jgi:putative hydrolase of the HAD superfamily
MLPFKVLLFDLGNTLIYFDTDWISTLNEGTNRLIRVLVANGFKFNENDFAKEFIGTVQESGTWRSQDFAEVTSEFVLRRLLANKGYPGIDSNMLRPAIDAYYSPFQQHWRVEKDAIATLNSLQGLGCRLGIISNAGDTQNIITLINNTGLRPFFKKIWVSAAVGFRKPHPRMYELALDYFQISPKDAVMVGDTLNGDILGANNMGIASIWITRRADTPENRADKLRIVPDQTIKNLDELPSLLMNW